MSILNLMFQKMIEVREFRRLRKKLPHVYRRFVQTPLGVRAETDEEYLARLKHEHAQRSRAYKQGGPASRSGRAKHRLALAPTPTTVYRDVPEASGFPIWRGSNSLPSVVDSHHESNDRRSS
jgi:hypothetical protein